MSQLGVTRGAALYVGALIGPGLLLVPALAVQAAGRRLDRRLGRAARPLGAARDHLRRARRPPPGRGRRLGLRARGLGDDAAAVTGGWFLAAVFLGAPGRLADRRLLRRRPHRLRHGGRGGGRARDVRGRPRRERPRPARLLELPARALVGPDRRDRRRDRGRAALARRATTGRRSRRTAGGRSAPRPTSSSGSSSAGRRSRSSPATSAAPSTTSRARWRSPSASSPSSTSASPPPRSRVTAGTRLARAARRPDRRRLRPRRPRRDRGARGRADDGDDERLHRRRREARAALADEGALPGWLGGDATAASRGGRSSARAGRRAPRRARARRRRQRPTTSSARPRPASSPSTCSRSARRPDPRRARPDRGGVRARARRS